MFHISVLVAATEALIATAHKTMVRIGFCVGQLKYMYKVESLSYKKLINSI